MYPEAVSRQHFWVKIIRRQLKSFIAIIIENGYLRTGFGDRYKLPDTPYRFFLAVMFTS